MDREYEYLLHLMGAYIKQETPRVEPDADWGKLTRLAHIHSALGILAYMVMRHGLCADEKTAASARKICMSTISGFAHRAGLADLFLEALSRNGIDHIVMKGYVLKEYYPMPELRSFGDIDIVIRPEDRQKCHDLMLQLGYQVKTDWEPVYSYTKPQEHYELHTELLETDISETMDHRAYFRDLWQHTEAVGDHRYQFRPEFHFLYLLVHLAKHIHGSGAGIRMYMDVAVFIRHFGDELDWNWVRDELKKLRFETFANAVLWFVRKYFGVDSPIALTPVADEVLESLAEVTVSGGVFGKVGHDSGTITLKSEKEDQSRPGVILKRLFPAAKTIESRYTYLQKRPWLLPVAWIHRLFRTKDTWGDHAAEAGNILKADAGEVRRIRSLYERIGL